MENYNKNLFNRFLAGIAVVNVKTHDEYDQFMRTLEKETNLKWMVGQKPTQFGVFRLDRERTCIHRVVSSDTIIFGDISYYDSKGYEIIEFSDLMKNENNMKFNVGDKVRVRSWDSAETEFGLDDSGNICLGGVRFFFNGMKSLCGNVYTIEAIDDGWYTLKESGYYLPYEMLEPVKAETNGEHFRNELRELKGHVVAIKNGKPATCGTTDCSDCLFSHNNYCIQKDEFKKWCAEPYEAQEDKPILDKVEHDYLASVIAPKTIYDNVRCIIKTEFFKDEYYIFIIVGSSYIHLPKFKKEYHMYDGMELDRPYTLEDLGLKK